MPGAISLTNFRLMFMTSNVANKPAAGSLGVLAAVTSIEAFMLANFGNPVEFDDAEQVWQSDVLVPVTTAKTWMLQDYYKDVGTDWIGNAKDSFEAYITKFLKEASDALVALIDRLATSCNNIQDAVTKMDLAVVLFTVVSTVFINAVFASYVATAGLSGPALGAAFLIYLTGLITCIVAMSTMFGVFQAEAQALQGLANDLAGKVWTDVEKRQNSRLAPDVNIPPVGEWHVNPKILG